MPATGLGVSPPSSPSPITRQRSRSNASSSDVSSGSEPRRSLRISAKLKTSAESSSSTSRIPVRSVPRRTRGAKPSAPASSRPHKQVAPAGSVSLIYIKVIYFYIFSANRKWKTSNCPQTAAAKTEACGSDWLDFCANIQYLKYKATSSSFSHGGLSY